MGSSLTGENQACVELWPRGRGDTAAAAKKHRFAELADPGPLGSRKRVETRLGIGGEDQAGGSGGKDGLCHKEKLFPEARTNRASEKVRRLRPSVLL